MTIPIAVYTELILLMMSSKPAQKHVEAYVEIKCQLDAKDEFLLQILLLAQHVSGTIMPIIRSLRVLYKWLLPVVFGAWFSSCRYGLVLRVVCPVCGLLQSNKICNKNHMLHLVGILFPHIEKEVC